MAWRIDSEGNLPAAAWIWDAWVRGGVKKLIFLDFVLNWGGLGSRVFNFMWNFYAHVYIAYGATSICEVLFLINQKMSPYPLGVGGWGFVGKVLIFFTPSLSRAAQKMVICLPCHWAVSTHYQKNALLSHSYGGGRNFSCIEISLQSAGSCSIFVVKISLIFWA